MTFELHQIAVQTEQGRGIRGRCPYRRVIIAAWFGASGSTEFCSEGTCHEPSYTAAAGGPLECVQRVGRLIIRAFGLVPGFGRRPYRLSFSRSMYVYDSPGISLLKSILFRVFSRVRFRTRESISVSTQPSKFSCYSSVVLLGQSMASTEV